MGIRFLVPKSPSTESGPELFVILNFADKIEGFWTIGASTHLTTVQPMKNANWS